MHVTVALLVTVGAAAGAQPRVAHSGNRLPVVPGAVDVVHERVGGAPQVRYDVREPLPASETIRQLADAMSKRGWTLADLGSFRDDAPMLLAHLKWLGSPVTHSWEGRWRDSQRREAAFHLSYRCPLEQHGLHPVWVQVWGEVYGSQEAEKRTRERQHQTDKQQRIRDELCRAGALTDSFCEK